MASQVQSPPPPTFPMSAYSHISARSTQITDNPTPFHPPAPNSHQNIASQQPNPFRTPAHSPQASESSSNVFSPVSPIDATDLDSRFRPQARIQKQTRQTKPAPAQMSSEPRKSVDLRKLDGKPYPGRDDESDGKPRKVKVAQDMYAGENPPGYDRQGFPEPLTSKDGQRACHKCGGHRKTTSETPSVAAGSDRSSQPQHDCQKCGGRKSMPPSSFPRGMANAQPRPAGQTARAPQVSSTEAGPSGHKHKCGKCGRRKRPDSVSTVGSTQAGATVQPSIPTLQTNGIPIMNIEPPTAMNERAPTLPFSPASVSDKPLIEHNKQQPQYKKGHSPARSGSISSLFRSLSRRKKSNDTPLPSQKLVDSGENTSHSYADKISHAIGHEGDKNTTHARLRPGDYPERPGSPFSFVDKPKEDQTFELDDMRKPKAPEQLERRNSWDKADESTKFLADNTIAERPQVVRGGSDQSYLRPKTAPTDDLFLSLPANQGAGVTRFKSLRQGVNRAADGLSRSASQIGRHPSLRRLESVKKVPQFWYRDDMAIEGAANEYNNYAY